VTVGAWLACGAFVAALAWLGRPDASPDGFATTLAAGLCGGFLGGALVVLIAGGDGVLATVSVCAAALGATVMLALTQRAGGTSILAPTPGSAARISAWSRVADPVLLGAVLALAVGDLTRLGARGVLAGLVAVILSYHPRAGLALLRRARVEIAQR
jgi:uncharacterized membrane protein YeaQ/YmgE (transglycosylase-associated protein family)